jgi:hypothetical protein
MPRDSIDLLSLDPWLGDSSSTQVALWKAESHWAALCPPPLALPVSLAPANPDDPPNQPGPL